jgi:hypothetical protein
VDDPPVLRPWDLKSCGGEFSTIKKIYEMIIKALPHPISITYENNDHYS